MLLSGGLERIGEECFEECGFERVSVPGAREHISDETVSDSGQIQAQTLGTVEKEPHCGHSSDTAKGGHSESKHRLVIEKEAFAHCKKLKQIVFEPDSVVEEIGYHAFFGSGLESFVAPPSLRKIGALAFGECYNLKTLELNKDIQELD